MFSQTLGQGNAGLYPRVQGVEDPLVSPPTDHREPGAQQGSGSPPRAPAGALGPQQRGAWERSAGRGRGPEGERAKGRGSGVGARKREEGPGARVPFAGALSLRPRRGRAGPARPEWRRRSRRAAHTTVRGAEARGAAGSVCGPEGTFLLPPRPGARRLGAAATMRRQGDTLSGPAPRPTPGACARLAPRAA